MNSRIARSITKLATFLLLGIMAVPVVGCSSDSTTDSGNGSAPVTPVATPPAAPPATPGATPAATPPATPAATPAAAVMCSGVMCTDVMSLMGALPACCDTDSGDICGATVGMAGECEGVGQEGADDATCPSEMSIAATTLAGCCKADGQCGVKSGTLMGCIERTDYPPTFLMSGTVLAAAACGAGGAAGTGAAGTGAAGAGAGDTVSAECMTYCTCMAASCATSTFPDSMTCEAFCSTGSDTAVTCWNAHCGNVATMGAAHCAHALGDGTVCPAM